MVAQLDRRARHLARGRTHVVADQPTRVRPAADRSRLASISTVTARAALA